MIAGLCPHRPALPRAMITQAIDRQRWNEVADGAVLQEDGVIAAIGTYAELSRKHPTVPVVGVSRPPIMLSSVLLPQPLGPIRQSNSPRVISSDVC